MIEKIVSGGQTDADRPALDCALGKAEAIVVVRARDPFSEPISFLLIAVPPSKPPVSFTYIGVSIASSARRKRVPRPRSGGDTALCDRQISYPTFHSPRGNRVETFK